MNPHRSSPDLIRLHLPGHQYLEVTVPIVRSQKQTFAPARTIMHIRTDKIEGILMNQLVIENMHAQLLSIIRIGASV